jgi:hypothetical protein
MRSPEQLGDDALQFGKVEHRAAMSATPWRPLLPSVRRRAHAADAGRVLAAWFAHVYAEIYAARPAVAVGSARGP